MQQWLDLSYPEEVEVVLQLVRVLLEIAQIHARFEHPARDLHRVVPVAVQRQHHQRAQRVRVRLRDMPDQLMERLGQRPVEELVLQRLEFLDRIERGLVLVVDSLREFGEANSNLQPFLIPELAELGHKKGPPFPEGAQTLYRFYHPGVPG